MYKPPREVTPIDPETAVAIKTRTPRGRFLTAQEQRFVGLYVQGLSVNAAAEAAGYQNPPEAARRLMREEAVIETLTALKMRQMDSLSELVTRDFVGHIFIEAHKKAATATEEIAAGRELGKLYGLYAPEKAATEINVTVNRIEQLEALSDEELMRRAQLRASSLSPATHRRAPSAPLAADPASAEVADADYTEYEAASG